MINARKAMIMAAVTGIIVLATGCGSKTSPDIQEERENTASTEEMETKAMPVYKTVSEFKESAERGEKCILASGKIEDLWIDGNVVFDGESFYVEGKEEEKYKYMVEIRGRHRNAEGDSYLVFLSQEEFTWDYYEFIAFHIQLYDEEGNTIYDGEKHDDMEEKFFQTTKRIRFDF